MYGVKTSQCTLSNTKNSTSGPQLLKSNPCVLTYFSAFWQIPRGSLSRRPLPPPQYTSHNNLAVFFSVSHGIIANVLGSGFNIKSESAMSVNPTIDDPSNFGKPSSICCGVKVSAEIVEFHVAPVVSPTSGLPYHEWLIEFESPPKDLRLFEKTIDDSLQEKNSYYKDLIKGKVLQSLKITLISKNGFRKYMQSVGKLGGQNKVPRLSNNRKIADKLLNI